MNAGLSTVCPPFAQPRKRIDGHNFILGRHGLRSRRSALVAPIQLDLRCMRSAKKTAKRRKRNAMLEPVLETEEIRYLQNQLSITVEHLKALHLTISSLMIDVSA